MTRLCQCHVVVFLTGHPNPNPYLTTNCNRQVVTFRQWMRARQLPLLYLRIWPKIIRSGTLVADVASIGDANNNRYDNPVLFVSIVNLPASPHWCRRLRSPCSGIEVVLLPVRRKKEIIICSTLVSARGELLLASCFKSWNYHQTNTFFRIRILANSTTYQVRQNFNQPKI